MARKQAAKAPKRSTKKPVKKPVKKAAKKSVRKIVRKAPAPRGFALQSVAPGFTANDAAASIAWYCDVLGFTPGERWEHQGQFRGGEVKSGSVTINLGQDDWKLGRYRVKGAGMRIYIATGPGIDAYAKEIQARGGTLAKEPSDEWGMRTFSIDDPDGFKLTFMAPAR